jgi:succinyl-diaminopimelate desuccinylase
MKEFLKRLIRADSTLQAGELAAGRVVADELARSAIEAELTEWDSKRANVIARVKGGGEAPALLFICHLDVVPVGEGKWKHDPFGAEESDGAIHGRGTCDMKGGTAAAVIALREIVDSGRKLKGDVILACTAGEEIDSCGVLKFLEQYEAQLGDVAGVIVPEPTALEVVTAHRGQLWVRITTRGKTAHGSAPHLGINAIDHMNLLLDELRGYTVSDETHELLGTCTLSVNTIGGGKAMNVIPDECSIEVDIRVLPRVSHERILSDLEAMFATLRTEDPRFDAEIAILRRLQALETDPGSEFVKGICALLSAKRTRSVTYATDGAHCTDLGAPIVILGPGDPKLCHQPDEYVEISQVQRAAELYEQIILKFLG